MRPDLADSEIVCMVLCSAGCPNRVCFHCVLHYQTYSDQMGNSRAGISSSGSGGSSGMAVCSDEVVGVTPFARLLAVFYYLSLLVFLSVAGSWLVLQLW